MNQKFKFQLISFLKNASLRRGAIFGSILVCALLAFEVFNFGTTTFALQDVLGNLEFAGMQWATILAFAFCAIDFAGIARIFTPEQGRDEPAEVYYLFGAWLLAAGFNAMLTWWGVSVAISTHVAQGGALIGQETMTKFAPIFVASMVWLVRVLLIGTFSIAGERLFTQIDIHTRASSYQPTYTPPQTKPTFVSAQQHNPRPMPKPRPVQQTPAYINRPEPTYHPVGMSAMNRNQNSHTPSVRR